MVSFPAMLELRSKAGESCLGGDFSSMVVLGDAPAVETAGEGGWGRMPKETEGFPILGAFAGGGLPTLGALGRATATGTGVSMHLGSNMKTKTLRHTLTAHTYGTHLWHLPLAALVIVPFFPCLMSVSGAVSSEVEAFSRKETKKKKK